MLGNVVGVICVDFCGLKNFGCLLGLETVEDGVVGTVLGFRSVNFFEFDWEGLEEKGIFFCLDVRLVLVLDFPLFCGFEVF